MMLKSLRSIVGFAARASDAYIGDVRDFLFDDSTWKIRYAVVGTGGRVFGRSILIPGGSFQEPEWDSRIMRVSLTREQVKNSPDIDSDLPVSGLERLLLAGYFGGMATIGATGTPVPLVPPPTTEAERIKLEEWKRKADPHLRSAKEVIGYRLKGSDGEVGHVEDFLVSDDEWAIAYLVVDLGIAHQWKKVLVSQSWAMKIHWNIRTVAVDVACESIRRCRYDIPETK